MAFLTLIGTSNGRNWLTQTIELDRVAYPYQPKLDAAVEALGERWCCHPSRHVPKGQYEQQTHGADVAGTFARIRDKLNPIIVIGETK